MPNFRNLNSFMQNVKDNVHSFFNQQNEEKKQLGNDLSAFEHKLSPVNESKVNALSDSMDKGKTITLSQPKSQRFTFNRNLATTGPVRNNFKPTTKEEKETLSPDGFFMGDKLGEKREELKGEKIEQARAKYRNLGMRFTKNREKEAVADAENARVEETEIPSTAIKTAKYDPKTESLWVTFTDSKKKYFYPRVPKDLIEKWAAAGSKGQFFLKNIHDQYTLNPGHSHKDNERKNKNIHNYYGKMQRYYKNVRRTGRM